MTQPRYSTTLLVVSTALLTGCASKPPAPAPAPPTASTSTSGTGAPWSGAPVAALRARALEALDAGDLRLAAEVLHELRSRAGAAASVRSLLASVTSIAAPSERVAAHPFANATLVNATPPPPVIPVPEGTVGPPVAWKIREDDAAFGVAQALGDSYFPAPEYQRPGGSVRYPSAVPAKLAGHTLLLLRPSGGHWLALYGRERADARFVAVLRADGTTRAVVDFAAWRAQNAIGDAGVSWAELDGDVLYVKTEVFAYDGFIAAVDLSSGQTLWRSERIAYAYNFVVTDESVVSWRWQPRSTVLVLDRKTGVTRSRTDMTLAPPSALLARGGAIIGADAPKLPAHQVVELRVPTHEPQLPADLTPDVAPATKLPANALSATEAATRLAAWAELDAVRPASAVSSLRGVLEKHPGNFATDALYTHSLAALREAHTRAGERLRGVMPVRVNAAQPDPKAHVHVERAGRPPHLRMVAETETRRHATAWFAESGVVPNRFDAESAAAPGPYPVNLAPEWVPSELLGAPIGETWTSGGDVVAIYGFRYVLVFRRGTFTAALDFGPERARDSLVLTAAALAGDALLVTVRPADSRRPFAAAFDLTTATPVWIAPGVEGAGFVVVDGYAITSSAPSEGQAAIVVLEADTGRVVQRVRAPKSFPSAYRLARQGNVLFGFGYVHACTLTVE